MFIFLVLRTEKNTIVKVVKTNHNIVKDNFFVSKRAYVQAKKKPVQYLIPEYF